MAAVPVPRHCYILAGDIFEDKKGAFHARRIRLHRNSRRPSQTIHPSLADSPRASSGSNSNCTLPFSTPSRRPDPRPPEPPRPRSPTCGPSTTPRPADPASRRGTPRRCPSRRRRRRRLGGRSGGAPPCGRPWWRCARRGARGRTAPAVARPAAARKPIARRRLLVRPFSCVYDAFESLGLGCAVGCLGDSHRMCSIPGRSLFVDPVRYLLMGCHSELGRRAFRETGDPDTQMLFLLRT